MLEGFWDYNRVWESGFLIIKGRFSSSGIFVLFVFWKGRGMLVAGFVESLRRDSCKRKVSGYDLVKFCLFKGLVIRRY